MNIDSDDRLPTEIDALRVVVETIGDNAVTQDELAVAFVLMGLLLRLERAEKRLH